MNHMTKHLSMPSLLQRVRCRFAKLPDTVKRRSTISLSDCLMSGLAVFGLKMLSLLQFEENLAEEEIRHNLKNLYSSIKFLKDLMSLLAQTSPYQYPAYV